MSSNTPSELVSSSTTPNQTQQALRQSLPETSTDTSEEYVEKTASLVSYAMLPNPVWRLWFSQSSQSDEDRRQWYDSMVKQFVGPTMATGAFIAEAGDFAASAVWLPPGSHEPPKSSESDDAQDESVFAVVTRKTDKVLAEHIWSKYEQNFWHLIILARDPRRPAVPGAVRALLQIGINRAAAEKQPIWLVTTSAHARDIYLHFGWQLVSTIAFGEHNSWCMILYPPV